MGLGIVINTVVPPTAAARQLIEQSQSVSNQAAFIFIDIDRAGTVRHRDAGQPLVTATGTHRLLHLAGYVSYLAAFGRADVKSLCRHGVVFTSGFPRCLAAPTPGAVAASGYPCIR